MLFLSVIILSATFVQNSSGYGAIYAKGHSTARSSHQTNQLARLIQQLESEKPAIQKDAKARLVYLAQTSRSARNRVVQRLVAVIDAPNVRYEIVRSGRTYRAFTAAADTLGVLKATEALDQLIRCLDCNDLVHGESASRYPVTLAVKKFGSAAVPQLRAALLESRSSVRVQAARTLGMIGSAAAQEALQAALRVEKEDDVRREIQIELNFLSRKSN